MKAIKIFLFFIIICSFSGLKAAQGRAPAVEDFVGVETQDYAVTTEGTEVFFNFDQNTVTSNTSTKQEMPSQFPFWVFVAFVTLPFIMWLGINRSLNQPSTRVVLEESQQIPENVEFLEIYQKEKQKVDEEDDDYTKKAS